MAQWGKTDVAANSVSWAAQSLNVGSGPVDQAANNTALFGNTTADAFITGVTVGQFGVSTSEQLAAREAGDPKPPASGWALRTVGSGGRSGRVSYETLVAGRFISGDASDDAVLPDLTIVIGTQPSDATANSAADEQATFTVATSTVPAGGTVSYLWQYTTDAGNTDSFATTAAVSGFSDQTTATLTADANTIADGTLVRVVVSATGADDVTSDNATLTVTS
jgi:hypothetical protein